MTRQWQIDEDLYGGVIMQHSCVQDAGIKESLIFDASGFASHESVCCLLAGEVACIERLRDTELQVLSTTWKSTDGTASHWKYVIGNGIVYRDVYRASVLLPVPTGSRGDLGTVWCRV
jgi:hypothetical protein